MLGYFALQVLEGWEPILLGIVAASMIYVAVADLIPGLHRRPELRATAVADRPDRPGHRLDRAVRCCWALTENAVPRGLALGFCAAQN